MAESQSTHAGSGTLLLILIQVASRGLTFVGNQFLLRFLSPLLLGIAVQLELVSVTCLYFARESLRVALQRQPPSSSTERESSSATGGREESDRGKDTQTVVNLSYLAVLLGFGISTAFGYSYLRSASEEILQSPYFDVSFQIYAVATLLELLAEPAFVVIQQKALYKHRARAETSAAMARCFAACVVAALGHRRGLAPSILPFAAGQAAYAFTLLSLYLLPTRRISGVDGFGLVPKRLPSASASSVYYFDLFHKAILGVAATMYMQSVFKLLLTQGDALIMSFLSSLPDQGAFALASNYGGLLARLVFQPVEESSRNLFGRLLSPEPSIKGTSDSTPTPSTAKLNQAEATTTSPKATNMRTALTHLSTTLHFYLLFSRPLVALIPPILPTVIPLALSSQWRTPSTITLLQIYCYYIPLMALNGILDAFVTSVATPSQLRAQSLWMVIFTGIYGLAAWVMMKVWGWGSVGLVGANIVNTAARIVWSAAFIRRWVGEKQGDMGEKGMWKEIVKAVVANAGCVLVSLLLMNETIGGTSSSAIDAKTGDVTVQFLGLWTASAVLLGTMMLYTDGAFLLEILESVLPQRLAAMIPAKLKRSNSTKDTPNKVKTG